MIGGVMALIMRAELARPGMQLREDRYSPPAGASAC
jgi:heme/copper-type cytochrome/quinol oxidase subunit 1